MALKPSLVSIPIHEGGGSSWDHSFTWSCGCKDTFSQRTFYCVSLGVDSDYEYDVSWHLADPDLICADCERRGYDEHMADMARAYQEEYGNRTDGWTYDF